MTPKLTAGRRLRQEMDAALKRAGEEIGQALEWDEAEEMMLSRAAGCADRAEELQKAYAVELAGEARPTALTRLSAEIRALDKQSVDLVRSVHVGVGVPKSITHQKAARSRWDRVPGRGA
ncbi:hypothetical protein [Mycolicibacterium gilvum]|uniref:Uncharacterized protein n=1 Tax=Mycolicibacterium gilvum (strain DSM 45189 / LMG 24558 / Spyr1) TaxID=278137 RepID=E6TMT3_MYCSR|nr:hypothetical protein [Mycolicibacterium gilvum]ADT97179.1 hypothetical protein Mspyr1_04680 [Mycolicibacterium gilvum Spyr1]